MNTQTSAETAQTTDSNLIRLNKFIARSGITSRRKADDLISRGKVQINGSICTEMGQRIDPENDEIIVNNIKIDSLPRYKYYILNKPKTYICAHRSNHGDKLVYELLPSNNLKTIGRLDKYTTGLLIATNDGHLVNNLSQPSKKVEKEYLVTAKTFISDEVISKLREGVDIEIESRKDDNSESYIYHAKPLKVELKERSKQKTTISITIKEGKKRQIRLMFKKVGYPHVDLKRVRIGKLELGSLEKGEYKELTKKEIDSYFN